MNIKEKIEDTDLRDEERDKYTSEDGISKNKVPSPPESVTAHQSSSDSSPNIVEKAVQTEGPQLVETAIQAESTATMEIQKEKHDLYTYIFFKLIL